MEKDLHKPPYEPVNTVEHFLYAMLVRLDALCDMMNSIIEYIAEHDNGTITFHSEEEMQEALKELIPE